MPPFTNEKAAARPPHTTAEVSMLPMCDFRRTSGAKSVSDRPPYHFKGTTPRARYDFKTAAGPWANGCHTHWLQHRPKFGPRLGLGVGQELILAKG